MVKPHVEEKAKTKQREKFSEKVKEFKKKITGQNLLKGAEGLRKQYEKSKSGGSSILDVFKSYGKYSGKPIELKGGGKAIKGLGRAFQKGGKV